MIAGIVIASLLLLVVGAGFYLESHVDTIVKREFSRLTDGRYRIDAGKINVSLLRRSITLNDIEIMPDSAYIPPAGVSVSRKILFGVSAKQLFASGISFKKHYGKLDLGIRKLQLSSPDIKIRQFAHRPSSSAKDTSKVKKPVRINVRQIILSGGSVEHTRIAKNDTVRNTIIGIELEIDKFFIDSDTLNSSKRLLGDNASLTITKIIHTPKDKMTRLEIDSIHIETGKQLLKFSRFASIPMYGKNEFAFKSPRHADWTSAALYDVECSGLDYYRLLNKSILKIDNISIPRGEVSSYKNRQIKRNEWIKTLFEQKMQRLPLKVDVNKVMIGNFYAQYEELALKGIQPGKITFNNLRGKITNLTNITPAKTPYIRIDAGAMVNNSGHLQASIFLPVDSLNNRFEVAATLGQTNIPDMNTMITPLTNVVIDTGIADKLTVHIVGTATRAKADMTFLYHDLHVTLLKEKNDTLVKRRFLSDIINLFVVRDSNPKRNEVKSTQTETTRDPYRSPFNYLWRTIFDGLKKTVL